ncbi:MAG: Na+/H+ antiporter NhaC family protein [Planctomycetaceae bacterium]
MSDSTTPDITEADVHFRGGAVASVVPMAVFLIATIALVVHGAPHVEGMILAAMLGISCGMCFAKNLAVYSEQSFALMANRVATVAVVCWLWAGAFSGIMADSGMVQAIVWIGEKLNLSGGILVAAVFVSAALFATSVGTGMGTIVGFTAVMYPAGVFLGANPAALIGAIISGAAFGDNVAPISDTTIVSAATQEADVGGVVRSRLKYVLIAAAVATVLFAVIGGGGTSQSAEVSQEILKKNSDPKGLPMLIPSVVVFVIAISGGHFLGALTVGIFLAAVIGPMTGVFEFERIFAINSQGEVTGSAVRGAMSLVPTAILTLLLVTAIGLMRVGGFLDLLMKKLQSLIAGSLRNAELAILALISFTNVCVSVNTVAMITAGPLANVIRKNAGIHPYRSANLLDTVSCSFPYLLPYATSVVAAVAIQKQVTELYPEVPVVEWSEFLPYAFYNHALLPLMVLSILTGFGRREG